MGKSPGFMLYAADFYMDTITWDCDDIGVYFRLLMAEWVNGPLDPDIQKLAKNAGKTSQKFIKNWSKISQKFSIDETGKLINLRLEETRYRQELYRRNQSEFGMKGANRRHGRVKNQSENC